MSTLHVFQTTPPASNVPAPQQARPTLQWRKALPGVIVAILLAVGVWALPADINADARFTLTVFAIAVWMWIFSKLDDTFVALGAAIVLVLANVVETESLFSALGDEQTWLLLGAFVVAASVSASGLATRAVVYLCAGQSSPRVLAHVLTAAVVATAYAIPATSGRAALIIPVFLALAASLAAHRWFIRALSLLLPVVVLLSAVGALIGAGAHLITVQILQESSYEGFSFTKWMMLGMPFALVCSHIATEIVLRQFSRRSDRKVTFHLSAAEISPAATQPLSQAESRVLLVLTVTIVLWCTETLHGIHPALVALLAALVVTSPWVGLLSLSKSIKKVPWNMILFMAATLALSAALTTSGATDFLAQRVLGGALSGDGAGAIFVVAITVLSAAAHVVIQSRSGRSAALIPVVIALAPVAGVNPVAAAFISTAAAGFCHTFPASAKPLTLFHNLTDEDPTMPIFTRAELTRFAAVYFPVFIALTLLFAFVVWPAQGLPLFL